MTTASPLTATPGMLGPAVPADLDVPRVPFTHLLQVELRKAVDTRSGRWLLAGMAVATAAVVVAVLLTDDAASLTFGNLTRIAALPPSLLLPVLAILTATTEWTQRTGLVTYTLEPNRSRVTLAKLGAVVTIGLLAVGFILARQRWATSPAPPSWTGPVRGTCRWGTAATWRSCSCCPCCRASPSGCCS
jgi:hypothetical protein